MLFRHYQGTPLTQATRAHARRVDHVSRVVVIANLLSFQNVHGVLLWRESEWEMHLHMKRFKSCSVHIYGCQTGPGVAK